MQKDSIPLITSIEELENRRQTLYCQVRLYADIGSSGSPGDFGFQTTTTTFISVMDHLADQINEAKAISCQLLKHCGIK